VTALVLLRGMANPRAAARHLAEFIARLEA
jgi:hypothetical protein